MKDPRMWRVPRLWEGSECFILGGGPGLKGVNLEPLRQRRVIAVNQAYKLAPWADACFYGDCQWGNRENKGLLDFAGLKVTTCERHIGRPDIHVVQRKNAPQGLHSDPGIIAWNLSSGAGAINLAAHLGVVRIVLLGYDMRAVDGERNWHNDYRPPEKDGRARDPYKRFMIPFPQIAQSLARLGIECVNATPGSELKLWPIVDPSGVIR